MEKEIWQIGKNGGTVITNNPENLLNSTGHTGEDALKYYGGHLICESIWRKKDAALISAAPELLDVLQRIRESGYELPVDLLIDADKAIEKATKQ